jgi:hypothetical protein
MNSKAFSERFGLMAVMAIMTIVMSAIAWAIFQPPTITLEELPWHISSDTKIFYPGDTVPLLSKRCNRTNNVLIYTVVRTFRSIENSELPPLLFPDIKLSIDPGCRSSVSELNVLPANIKQGTYQIVGFAIVKGPLGDIQVPYYSEPFVVREKIKKS